SRVIEPRNSSNAEAFAVGSAGAATTIPCEWRGIVGSAGVGERGIGTGRIAWEPGRSRLRPRANKPADWVAGRTMTGLGRFLWPFWSASCETRRKEYHGGPGRETNKRRAMRRGKS